MADVMISVADTEQELRAQREQIYCASIIGMCTPENIAKLLGITDTRNIPSLNRREHNFYQFVKQHFLIEKNVLEYVFQYSWSEPDLIYNKAYKTFHNYSKTPYGAVMIKKVMLDHRTPNKISFKVRQFNEREAAGATDFISFPEDFPKKTVLVTGDKVDPLAAIHHEFGHTRYSHEHNPGELFTAQDERIAVINWENPARMFNNNEPRYAYYNPAKEDKDRFTINIITGEVKAGLWTFDKTDPRILVKPN